MSEADPNLHQRFFRLTFWNVLSNVTVPLAGLVDTAMLGHLPDIRFLAGVALAGVIFDFLYWSFGFLRMGTTGMTAQAVGRGDSVGVHRILQRSMVLAGVIAAAVVMLKDPLGDLSFSLLSGESAVEEAGRDYYDIRIWGAPAVFVNFVFLGWFLGREESRLALVMTLVASLANVLLNYVFIVRLGLAAQGAGLATMLSQYLSATVALALYLPRRHGADWRWREIFHRRKLLGLLRLHGDILIRTLVLVSAFSLFTNLSALLGTAILTANTLLLRIFMVASHLVDGVAYSTESLAGIFYGARDRSALGHLLKLALVLGLATVGFVAAAVLVWPTPILGFLTSHADIVRLASGYRFLFALVLLVGAAAFVFDGFFLGLTAGRVLRNAMLVSFTCFFLPLAYAALLFKDPHLLWTAMIAFMAARVATLGSAARRAVDQSSGQRS